MKITMWTSNYTEITKIHQMLLKSSNQPQITSNGQNTTPKKAEYPQEPCNHYLSPKFH